MSFNSPKNVYFGAVKIYSVGVWNLENQINEKINQMLKFTPLEFETIAPAVANGIGYG